MDFSEINEQLQILLNCADMKKNDINLFMIASIKDTTQSSMDYKRHSVTTSYLSRQTLDELLISCRKYSNYLQVYTDVEEFLMDYYNDNFRVRPTLIFETSPKGTGRGKDALIPALCDIWKIPHLGPTASANTICSSKYQWTSILKENGLSVPDSYFFHAGKWIKEPPIGIKYILKLNYECASIGLFADSVLINDGKNITRKALELSKEFNQPIIAQKYIEGYEVEVPILSNHNKSIVLPPIGLSVGTQKYYTKEFFDYDVIYTDDYSFYSFCDINEKGAQMLIANAYKIIDCLDLNGYMRIDFRIDSSGNFFVFDINNDPCISKCGSFHKSIEVSGFHEEDIVGIIIGNALI